MKSYVTLERHICPVCTKEHNSGSLLMDMRLRDSFEHHTLNGWGLCDEHQKQADDGYVFLVGADESKSKKNQNGTLTLEGAHRTGEIVSIRKHVAEQIFTGVIIPENGIMFCGSDVITKLQEMQAPA